jgi:predicted metalloprotease
VGGGGASSRAVGPAQSSSASEDELARFVGFVFDDVQKTWSDRFERAGDRYRPARLVLFTDAVATGCGTAPSDVGPFYCPSDQRVYIDLGFYRELRQRFGAAGDFAQAYVIAHEVGHHVETLRRLESPGSNRESVRYELLADCLAGVWASDAAKRDLLESGDLEEALGAASAIGDDRIQKQTSGQVNPETWTHGSSAERRKAFDHGYGGGSQDACGVLRGR